MDCRNASEQTILKNSKRTVAEKVFLAFCWLIALISSGHVSLIASTLNVLKIEMSICKLVTIKKAADLLGFLKDFHTLGICHPKGGTAACVSGGKLSSQQL